IAPLRRPHPAAAPGYAMPLAVGVSGVLLLMSFTLHGMAMQERVQVGARERQQREEDLLASAAHQLLAALNRSHACLLPLPLAHWELKGGACASPAAVAALKAPQVMEVPVQLLVWQPGGDGQTVQLTVQLKGAPGQAARRGRYGVRLKGSPPLGAELGPRLLGSG
ncbi:MAG: hypothetical protein VKM17_07130, partial [Cyanobacteriota bacterium]|nr:hypothetical protein [Cyanobacteriota bacterium]